LIDFIGLRIAEFSRLIFPEIQCLMKLERRGCGSPRRSPHDAALTVVLRFDHAYSRAMLGEMKGEFHRILSPTAVGTRWFMSGEKVNPTVGGVLLVARFRGVCRADRIDVPVSDGGPSGSTHLVNGEILPFPDIDCERVRAIIAARLGMEGPMQCQRLLGRALARVLAHEVYHVVLQTSSHGPRGIMKASLTAEDLVGATLRFEPEQLAQIGAALKGEAMDGGRRRLTAALGESLRQPPPQ